MDKKDKKLQPDISQEKLGQNEDWQGNDKAPGEDLGKQEKVTEDDLKGKKVDADPSLEKDQPASES
jgi:hypothetical protein